MNQVIQSEPDAEADGIIAECTRIGNPRSFFLFAGAGSGKTRSLVTALRDIRTNQRDVLLSRGQKVAVITYTNAASEVISQRLEFDPLVHVSTIHSFAWGLIRGYNADIRKWLRAKLQTDIDELRATLAKSRPGTKAQLERESSLIEKSSRLAQLDQIKTFIYSPTGENSTRDSLTHAEAIGICASFLHKKTLQAILVGRFPFLFIDESQDTNKNLVDSFFAVQAANRDRFCLGLFGDMMQRIYSDGKVDLDKMVPDDWAKPEKKMNWRCPKRVVRLINEIRKPVDGRRQITPADKLEGVIRCFIYPTSTEDKQAAEAAAAKRMAEVTGDPEWSTLGRYKTLTLEHHMAARRLGFGQFFLPLYGVGDFRTGLIEGSLSGLPLLFNAVLPLVEAIQRGDKFEIARVVRTMSPMLERKALAGVGANQVERIQRARAAVADLSALLQKEPEPRTLDVIKIVAAHQLFEIPENLRATLRAEEAGLQDAPDDPAVTTEGAIAGWYEALQAPFNQVRRTADYLSDVAEFDTHQGVKGREFPRVMVVMDDDEARGFLFSFDKLLGAKARSKTDLEHEAKGEETTIDRTRRLFYVTCSRAESSLALIAYSPEPNLVRKHLIQNGWFTADEFEMTNGHGP
ncbi:MAG: UvrD-helicase domain-containing protein [Steroidobacteraceae bacterium]